MVLYKFNFVFIPTRNSVIKYYVGTTLNLCVIFQVKCSNIFQSFTVTKIQTKHEYNNRKFGFGVSFVPNIMVAA